MFFKIGKILKPHGLKGNLKIYFFDEERKEHIPDFFYIESEKYYVETFGKLGKNFIIKFKGINSRIEAEKFFNKYLELPEKDLLKLKNNQYHAHTIVGSKIISSDNVEIGKVLNIIFLETGDVLEVEIKGKRETLLFKKDFFSIVDPEKKILKLKYKEDYYAF